jgi:hypothetical protein
MPLASHCPQPAHECFQPALATEWAALTIRLTLVTLTPGSVRDRDDQAQSIGALWQSLAPGAALPVIASEPVLGGMRATNDSGTRQQSRWPTERSLRPCKVAPAADTRTTYTTTQRRHRPPCAPFWRGPTPW